MIERALQFDRAADVVTRAFVSDATCQITRVAGRRREKAEKPIHPIDDWLPIDGQHVAELDPAFGGVREDEQFRFQATPFWRRGGHLLAEQEVRSS